MKWYFRAIIPALLIAGCTPIQHISNTEVTYTVLGTAHEGSADPDVRAMIEPYKVQVDEKMNEVLANITVGLTKKKPESTLGNWYSDAMMATAKQKGYDADFAISNYGGLRIPEITAGPLTRGELYELCPFDNLMVIVEVPAYALDSLLQQIAVTEGWPVSGELRMIIRDKKMLECTIHGKPIMASSVYQIVMPDYVANGGDGMSVLIPLPRIQTGMLVRDVLIDYAKETAKAGLDITASIEGRIIIQP
jgi:2',3'-cyclic-nucleotide 2'-phosphodiesterase (5'-nucleotidase family)